MKKRKIAKKILSIVAVACVLWIGVSFVNIINHNTALDASYAKYANWNFFTLIGKIF